MKHIFLYPVIFLTVALFFSCTKLTDEGTALSSDALMNSFTGSSSAPGGGSGGSNAGVITAGEWNDIDNWDFWTGLLQKDTINKIPAIWGLYTSNKVSVVLRDANNKLLHDVSVTMTFNGTAIKAKTDNAGRAILIAGLTNPGTNPGSFNLKADYLGKPFDLGSFSNTSHTIYKNIPVVKSVSNQLDILFVVDATGSMGDEISFLKTELLDVINRSGSQLPGIKINMGSIFYRDNGDDYLTRPFNFTSSPQQLINFIRDQQAGGGGDFPEAVDEALKAASQTMQWTNPAVNRLLFLILDAPPHQTAASLNRLNEAIKTCQEKGIKIIPISASGIDRETEFLLRSMAISANGTYVFITNHSGIGNPHLTPTVGTYTVEFLNNLMVRLITKYGKNMD